MSARARDHEEAVIKAFVVPDKQERFLGFISNAKRRDKFLRELAHFRHLNPRFITPIPTRDHTPGALVSLLRGKGTGETCWVISEWERLDGREMSLESALSEIVGYGMGTIVSCVPGRLAYFEDEDGRFILERREAL